MPLWSPGHLWVLLPVSVYALMFHHFIPALAHPVSDKSKLHRVFAAA